MQGMKPTRREFSAALLAMPAAWGAAEPPRKLRRDCFFGLHFDLHPQKTDKALGRDLTEEMAARLLERVQPDFVQYDCKGHAGYLGFESKTGYSAPGIVRDSLAIWRRATARRGVGLYVHFSGVWDALAAERHPEWARVTPEGKPDDRHMSLFGPYVDELMIPELEEAAAKYGLDGAWVDGECWAAYPDFSEPVKKAFAAQTGLAKLPRSAKDPGWIEFLEINREQFRRYVRHYVDTLHARRPGFQIASNWLYSTFVPERPELPVDFLSGDYLGVSPIATARLEARYLASTGKPWDLMAWGFHNPPATGFLHKPAVQLEQEASVVLGQGGGFQIYYVPTRAGHIDDRHVEVAARVARFCRERQSLAHKSDSIPQVGVLFSRHSLYHTADRLFGGWGQWTNSARGIIEALLASHYSVDVIPDWKMAEAAAQYPLIVVPDWSMIGDDAVRDVKAYVSAGGTAIVVGAENAASFGGVLGVELRGKPQKTAAWVPGQEVYANLHGLWQSVSAAGAEVIERRFAEYDSLSAAEPAATVATLGRGRIAGVYGPLGTVYAEKHAPEVRAMAARLVKRLFEPAVELDAPPVVELALRRKGDRTIVHLSNLSGMSTSEEHAVIDFVPPVGPVEVRLRTPRRPSSVVWEPGGAKVAWKWSNGVTRATVERLELHGMLAVS